MHKLLKEQLKTHIGPEKDIPEEWQRFIEAVSETYRQADEERAEHQRARAEAEEARRQLETALEEMMSAQRRYVQEEWRNFTLSSGAQGYAISVPDNIAGPTTEAWLPAMTTAVQQVKTTVETDDEFGATLAVPMHMYGESIGVLAARRDASQPWSAEEIAAAETIAEQLGLALENLRLFEQTQSALEEVEATHRRYVGRAWNEYVRAQEITGYEQRELQITPLTGETLPEVRQTMIERGTVILDDSTGSPVLVTPIMVRNQPIGALGFRMKPGQREWTADDIALAEAIGEQLGLAAENLRLLDETQRRAAREHTLGEIADRMQRAADMETLLRITSDELNRALGGSRAYVRLGSIDGSARQRPNDE